ncbi:MAG: Methyltransferase [Candidatus Tokpelaia hoelldobleri]|uniref:Methyltransferase n=1 Tax=Candidatus Tokpelaia hoelldobleri TaxID=1902579 RepID=A0A1U9JTK0_9HYPH|nr:MAG: Methyltransferase [Candidatus Tokpelaia hoelldoblerii]
MDIPAQLRAAVEQCLNNTTIEELSQASEGLSKRYRAETRDGRMHIADRTAAGAYLAARLPATYAATHCALSALAQQFEDFAPATLFDAGAGPGTALFAASALFPTLTHAILYEQSTDIIALGRNLCRETVPFPVIWQQGDFSSLVNSSQSQAELVTLAYVLGELAENQQVRLADFLWQITSGAFVIIEPGTPAGWQRLLRIRNNLLLQGAFIAAPCPHSAPCPLAAPDWCHFSVRLARSRLHRQTKQGTIGWEDEKFIYMAFTRQKPENLTSRVIAPPRKTAAGVSLKLCNPDGTMACPAFAKRDKQTWKSVRKATWGSKLQSLIKNFKLQLTV